MSDYEAVGGGPAVGVVVDDFYRRVLDDGPLAHHFEGVDMARLKRHQALLVAQVMGGPAEYKGLSLREAHAGKGITEQDFTAVAMHLYDALDAAGVPAEIIERTIDTVAATRAEIVQSV